MLPRRSYAEENLLSQYSDGCQSTTFETLEVGGGPVQTGAHLLVQ